MRNMALESGGVLVGNKVSWGRANGGTRTGTESGA